MEREGLAPLKKALRRSKETEQADGAGRETVVIPVYDEDHRGRGAKPWAMWAVFAANVLAFACLVLVPGDVAETLFVDFGVVPRALTQSLDDGRFAVLISSAATLFTYTFLHGSWLHLTANMIFLWVFGDDVEAAMGHVRFAVFYLLCGAIGAVVHVVSDPGSTAILVGASGAIGGIIAAYLMLRPWAHVVVLVFGLMTLRIHAFWLLGAWIAWEAFNLIWSTGIGTSHWTHAGGLLAGAALVLVLRKPGTKLFQRHVRHPAGSRSSV